MRRNADATGLRGQVEVREGPADDVLAADERFDLVIADPPWVRHAETDDSPDDPPIAIDGGPDGLDVAWSCIRACEGHLAAGGSVVLQLGSVDQAHHVRDHLRASDVSACWFGRSALSASQGVLVQLVSGDA